MRALRGTLLTAALCVLCAAALALPTLAAAPDGAELYGAVEAAQAVISDAERRPDNDALFYGYLLRRAGASDSASLMSDARSALSVKDQELYDALRAFAAKVADGEETSAKCVITYEDFPRVWTKEDLGVSAIVEVKDGVAQLTNECDDAISAKLSEYWGYNLEAVRNALLADCPYELYWYDKLPDSSMTGASDAPFGASKSKVQFSEAPSYTVSVLVSQGYQGADSFTVNRNLHKGIDKVVSTAASIVSRYAGKSDYEKLLGYSTEICNLTEYDTDAAEKSANMPYGDPWQLISVFDGDDATKVVCEGYAKAFKYLCDLSSFSSEKLECRIVTGALKGGTGAGEHMWNIVTMENGKNYLVDVTNSDGGRGAGYLLLKGAAPDNAQATQYTFYKSIVYLYDAATLDLWDSAALTLDVADYEPAQDGPQVSAPLQVNGYNVSSTGKAVSMADLRKGVKIAPDIAVTDNAPKTAGLLLVVYDAQGKMADLQIWELDLSKPLTTIQTKAVPQSADAVSAKFIILSESFAPLASAFSVESR